MGLKSKYERFILENSESVGHVESLLRTALFLVPGRFRDSELTTEVAYTGVGLVSLYHDYISTKNLLQRGISSTAAGEPVPPPYSLNIAKWLSFFQNVELLAEVFFNSRFGEKGRWSAVCVIELLKTMLRFKLLLRTNGNILVHQSIPARDNSPAARPNTFTNIESKKYAEPVAAPLTMKTVSPTGKKIRKTLLDFQAEEKEQKMAAFATNTLMSLLPPPPPPPPDMVRRLVGESLYILRPLIYLISMYLYGKKSWRPWLLSLGTDITSWWCLSYSHSKLPVPEKDEVRRRTILWLYYFVRSPFFEKFIGEGFPAKVLDKVKYIPLVRALVGTLFDYVMIYRERYFYTSAS